MGKTEVNYHSGNLIVLDSGQSNLFSNVYDDTYPRVNFRGAINLLGGNQQKSDTSPRALLERELCEEFSGESVYHGEIEKDFQEIIGEGPGAPKVTNLAPREVIHYVRDQLIAGAVPYQDFLTEYPESEGRPGFKTLTSVFVANPEDPEKLFNLIRRAGLEGRSLVNEGFTKVTPVDDLLSEKVRCAWHAGHILRYFLGKDIPCSPEIKLTPVGMPRDSFENYFPNFEYKILGR